MKFLKCNRSSITGAVLVVALLLLITCGTKEVGDPLGISNFNTAGLTSLTNSKGLDETTFYTFETIFLTIDGLIPLEQTQIEVVRGCPDCLESIKRCVVVTDRNGKIANLPVWQHVGVDQQGKRIDQSGNYTLHITQPPKLEPWTMIDICFEVVNDISTEPQIHATMDDATFKGQAALTGEDVYVTGYHVSADTARLYVVPHQMTWVEGIPLTDVSGGFEVVTPTSGDIKPTLVWAAAPITGSYDLVADVKPFGVYNKEDVVSDPMMAGLVVQNAPGANPIIVDIAADEMGVHRNTFDELDPIFAQVDPNVRPADLVSWMYAVDLATGMKKEATDWVPVYVMPHRDAWLDSAQLVTERTVGTHQMPCFVQINPMSGAVSRFRLRGETKAGYYHPLRLWPGDYDVIVDVNRNCKYDAGVDLLDGGSQVGFRVTSVDTCPAVRLINTADEDLLERGHNSTHLWAYLVRPDNSPIPNAKVKFIAILGPGKVETADAITDAYGMAVTKVFDISCSEMTRVRTETVVDDVLYYDLVSLYGTCGCGHNQGHNQGSVGGQ
jgi:hypothetical protein